MRERDNKGLFVKKDSDKAEKNQRKDEDQGITNEDLYKNISRKLFSEIYILYILEWIHVDY